MTRQNILLLKRSLLVGLTLSFFLLLPDIATAAKKNRGDRMLEAYFRAETERVANACQPGSGTLDEWKADRKILRARFFEMLGLDPLPEKTDLKPTVTGTIERDGVVVEKLHFQSMPGLYVTANLYRPAKVDKPLPTILYLCGHGGEKEGKISYGNKTHYRHHGAWFAQHGYVCLMLDSLQKGEIEGIHNGTRIHGRWWWCNRGYTPAGVEAFNCIRALDYLETRPEVDMKRIGATGRSGGGTYTWDITALDDRIAVAAPVAGMTDLQNHIVDGKIRHHCDCNFFVNVYRWDFPMVASLAAPRPLLICHTTDDPIFPLDGVRRIYEKVRRVYQLYGKENDVRLFVTSGKHDDVPPLQTAVFEWFNKYLKNDTTPVKDAAKSLFTREELRVFDKLPKDQINTKIDELFVPQAKFSMPRGADESYTHYKATMKNLREKVFAGWPDKPCDLDVKRVDQKIKKGHTITTYEYTSQEHVRLPLYIVGPADPSQVDTIDIRLISEEEWKALKAGLCDKVSPKVGASKKQPAEGKKKEAFVRVFVPTRGIGPTRWSGKKNEQINIRRRFMALGQTLDGMRIWDARRAVQAVRKIYNISWKDQSPRITFSGGGVFGTMACYASLFEYGIRAVGLPAPLYDMEDYQPTLLNGCRRKHPLSALYCAMFETTNYLCCPRVTDWSEAKLVYATPGITPERIGICRSGDVLLTCRDEKLGSLSARVAFPDDYKKGKGSYPLLLFLHGAGERGTDSVKQLTHGEHFLRKAGMKHCFVLAPQCPPKKIWAGRHWKEKNFKLTEKPSNQMQLVMKMVDTICEQYPIDKRRIYIMGLSMGGFGTWEAVQRWPERFAAAVPICGGGDHTYIKPIAKSAPPIWAFHGDKDKAVPVERSRQMVEALKKAGVKVKYTEYPGVGHNSWDNTFAEPGLLDWILSQQRAKK